MNDDTLLPFELPSVRRKKLTVDFAGGNQSSDGGLLLLREAERKLGVCRRLAGSLRKQDVDLHRPMTEGALQLTKTSEDPGQARVSTRRSSADCAVRRAHQNL